MPKQVVLRVYANAFAAELDHEGRPHGHVRFEPSGNGADGDAHLPFLGCHLIATPRKSGDGEIPPAGSQLHHSVKMGDQVDYDHVWEYDIEPTTVPLTRYYLDLCRQHGHHGAALLCADLESHMLVFGTREGFHDPRARLHRYVMERGATPRLRPSPEVHAAAQNGVPRDHGSEWAAFVGPHAQTFAPKPVEPPPAPVEPPPALVAESPATSTRKRSAPPSSLSQE